MLIIVIFDKESLVCSLTLYAACLVLTLGCQSISLKTLRYYHTHYMLFDGRVVVVVVVVILSDTIPSAL
jgi:hypothetical protein